MPSQGWPSFKIGICSSIQYRWYNSRYGYGTTEDWAERMVLLYKGAPSACANMERPQLEERRELNEIGFTLAFADDIVILCEGELRLHKVLQIIKCWSIRNGIEINKKKSAIMTIRVDKRTVMNKMSHINNYPLLNSYKYLGVHIDDALQFKDGKAYKNKLQK